METNEETYFDLNNMPYIEINKAERNSLYSLAGYVMSKISTNSEVCEECLSELLITDHNEISLNKNAELSVLNTDNIKKFKFVKDGVFKFFLDMEIVTRHFINNFKPGQLNMSKAIKREIMNLKHPFTDDCDLHNATSSIIIQKFVLLRLRISTQKRDSLQTFNFDSYSLR